MASVTYAPSRARASASRSGFLGWNLNPLKSISNWNLRRQTRNSLSALTDRQLDDIGLVRGDIDDLAFNWNSAG